MEFSTENNCKVTDGNEYYVFLHQLLKMGEMMMCAGAEINRVEDTLARMGKAYGATQMNVFVITSSIIITMMMPEGYEVTQTRRIRKLQGADYQQLEALNDLSRKYCTTPMEINELKEALQDIKHTKVNKPIVFLGSALAGGSFALFFGGDLIDGAVAAFFGLVICFMQIYLEKFFLNRLIFNLVCSFVTGLGICAIAKISPIFHADKIMIGDIMLLIPGVAMTNAIRDMLVGDTISGAMKLIETVLWSAALACGFMVAILLIGV